MELLEIAREDLTLRPYQTKSKEDIYKAWESVPSVMFQMPTGTGKTRLFASIIKDIQTLSVRKKERMGVLVLVHRSELIEQIHETLSFKYGIAHGIIKAGFDEDRRMPVQVASVQSLTRRLDIWKEKSFSYIVIDEAHHAMAKTYRKICDLYPKAKILGVTATPYRLSGESFRDLFGKLIVSQGVSKFIEQGYLSPYDYYSIKPNSSMQQVIDNIAEFGADGDYSEAALLDACDKDHIRAELVKAYKEYANGKKGIIYTINRAHNDHVCSEFKKIGLRVVAIDGKTPAEKRKMYVSEFRAGKIDIICNVNIFSEGFDCPDIEFIQLARPTLSLALYLQQVGRALRLHAKKNSAVIIDNVGLYNRFGLPSANRQWKRHFEGKCSAKNEAKHNMLQSRLMSREQNFEEGDENLELIYTCTSGTHESVDTDNTLEVIRAFTESERFPLGLNMYIEDLNQRSTVNSINRNKELSPEEKKERIQNILSIDRVARRWTDYEVLSYDNIDDWIDQAEQCVMFDNDDDCDSYYDQMTDYLAYVRRFKYKEKYGVGRINTKFLKDLESKIVKEYALEDVFDMHLEPIFDYIKIPNSVGVLICSKGGKEGVLDEYLKTEIVPFKYDEIDEVVSKYTFIVRKGDKYGVVTDGKMFLKPEYDLIISQKIDGLLSPASFIVLKDNSYGFYDIQNKSGEIMWRVVPTEKLNDEYSLALSRNNRFWFIVNSNGHIGFPWLISSLAVTDNPDIPFILSWNLQDKTYLSQKLEILTPETEEDKIIINSLTIVAKYLNGKKVKVKQKQKKMESTNTATVLQTQTAAPGVAAYDDDKIIKLALLWSNTYGSVRKIKEHGAELIKEHGKDNYKIVMAAYKTLLAAAPDKTLEDKKQDGGNIVNDDKVALATKALKEGFSLSGTSYQVVLNQQIIEQEEFESIVKISDSYYKYKRNGMWGVFCVKDNKEVNFLVPPICHKVKLTPNNRLCILTISTKRNEYIRIDTENSKVETEVLNITCKGNNKIVVTECADGARLYVNFIEYEALKFIRIEFLYDGVFKYQDESNLWGLFRINKNGSLEILKQPMYDKLELHDMSKRQLMGTIGPRRPRLLVVK